MKTSTKAAKKTNATQWLGVPEYNCGGPWKSFALVRGDLYRVVCTRWSREGSSYEMHKIEGDSVVSESSIETDRHGFVRSCSCKGFQFRISCKHAVELPQLIDEAEVLSF